MANAKGSLEIAAPQEKVWAILSDPARFEEWLTLHTKWKTAPPATLSQGATMSEVLTIMGMANTIDFTVEEYDAPNTTTFSGTGMAGAKISFSLQVEPKGADASIVTVAAEFISQMMVGAIGGAIERASNKEIAASLEKLAVLAV